MGACFSYLPRLGISLLQTMDDRPWTMGQTWRLADRHRPSSIVHRLSSPPTHKYENLSGCRLLRLRIAHGVWNLVPILTVATWSGNHTPAACVILPIQFFRIQF